MKTAAAGERAGRTSPQLLARIAGLFYLLNILTIFLAIFFFRGLVVPRDPAATAANILRHESLFRLGFSFELISTTCSLVVAALFYELFKPVNRNLSLIAAFFRLIACTTAVFGYLLQLAPLQILGGAQFPGGFQPEELQALALVLNRLGGSASDVVIVFFWIPFRCDRLSHFEVDFLATRFRGVDLSRRLGSSDLSGAAARKAFVSLLRGRWASGRGIANRMAPCDGCEQSEMEGKGERRGGVVIATHVRFRCFQRCA